MSCQACELAQALATDNYTGHVLATYIRVGNGNVLISGCTPHLQQLIDIYRKGLEVEDDEPTEST